MRVVVADEYYYEFDNYGDVALFNAMVTHLRRLWPAADIRAVTCAPSDLAAHWPFVGVIPPEWYHAWLSFHYQRFLGRWGRRLPQPLSGTVTRVEKTVRRRWPGAARAILNSKGRLRGHELRTARRFEDFILGADMVVVTGGGHFIQGYENHALNFLKVLSFAIRHGRPTAMFSQGIPRVRHPELLAWMREVLPEVDHIAVREGRDAVPFLTSLGVERGRIFVTGDDAIEAAYVRRTDPMGRGIGVNVRRARYSEVDDAAIAALRDVIHAAARRHEAPLIPVPISAIPGESDAAAIRALLSGFDDHSDGGADVNSMHGAIAAAARCRLVVTGSYHAAVFALSQGIPAVGLARSEYYIHKFGGLADQFGGGCEVIRLDAADSGSALAAAIDRLWDAADEVRPSLLSAAAAQIARCRESYDRVRALAGGKKPASARLSTAGRRAG